MTSFFDTLGLLAGQNLLLAYFILYLATIFLGNISAFVGFWIIFHGHIGAWGVPLLIATIFLANLSGDLLWYSLGRATRNTRVGTWIRKRLPLWHEKAEHAFEHNGKGWIFLSKFIYASSFPVIFTAGWTMMPFRRFIKNSVLSILVWLPILVGLAYGLTSGLSPLRAVAAFRDFELVFFLGLALFLFLDYLLAKFVARALARRERRADAEDAV